MRTYEANEWGGAKLAPLSLYVHIPFCAEKCHYCDFLSFSKQSDMAKERYLDALCMEIDAIEDRRSLDTIFIGGGTPSVLSKAQMNRLFQCIRKKFPFSENAEMTIEANPGTLNPDRLALYRQLGISRISFGVQAFDDALLQGIGRIHTAEKAQIGIVEAQEAGFENINIDLMIGLPNQSIKQVQDSIQCAVDLDVTHISVYALILEEETPLYHLVQSGAVQLPHEDEVANMLDIAEDLLELHGFEQYELSNFARFGFECRHNCAYWRLDDYIGVGLGSAGCIRKGDVRIRTQNTEDMDDYIQRMQKGASVHRSCESIARKEQVFERIMLGLRMNEGISWKEMQWRFGCNVSVEYREAIEKNQRAGLLQCDAYGMRLTRQGRRLQNRVLLDFMEA